MSIIIIIFTDRNNTALVLKRNLTCKMESIQLLPPNCWELILIIIHKNSIHDNFDTESRWLRWLCSCRCTSKKLSALLSDEFIIQIMKKYSMEDILYAFLDLTIVSLIRRNNFAGFDKFIRLAVQHNAFKYDAMKLLSRRLPFVVDNADLPFLKSFLSFKLSDKALDFDNSILFDAIRLANFKASNETALLLVPLWFSKCLEPDGQRETYDALKNGEKLVLTDLRDLDAFTYERNRQIVRTNWYFRKMRIPFPVIPSGTLLVQPHPPLDRRISLSEEDKSNFELEKIRNGVYEFSYLEKHDHFYLHRSIRIKSTEDRQFEFNGITTPNFYELMVKANLFERIFNTFTAHRITAVTEESLRKPLHEQPWFFGFLDTPDRNKLNNEFNDLPNKDMIFFTYSIGCQIYLRYRDLILPINSSEELIELLPKKEMIVGLYNLSERNVADYLVYLHVRNGDLSACKRQPAPNYKFNFRKDKKFHENNLVSEHLLHAEPINEELITWLLDKGIPFAGTEELLNLALQKCTPKLCKDLWIAKFHTRKIAFKQLMDNLTSKKLLVLQRLHKKMSQRDELDFLFNEQYWIQKHQATFQRSDLILHAWKSENDNNYFKMLPAEIIMKISEYDINTPPLFHQLVTYVIGTYDGHLLLQGKLERMDAIENFLEFAVQNKQLNIQFKCFGSEGWYFRYLTTIMLDWIYVCNEKHNKNNDEALSKRLYYCVETILNKFPEDKIVISREFLKSWITSDNESLALKIIELLISKKKIKKEQLDQKTEVLSHRSIPISWGAILHNKKDMFFLLLSHDLMYEPYPGYIQREILPYKPHWLA